jgi:hypothetical protein
MFKLGVFHPSFESKTHISWRDTFITPCECCGASAGNTSEFYVKENPGDWDSNKVNTPTKGIRFFPTVVPDDVVESVETHNVHEFNGVKFSYLTVDKWFPVGSREFKFTEYQTPEIETKFPSIVFIYWESVVPCVVQDSSRKWHTKKSDSEWKEYKEWYLNRDKLIPMLLEQGHNLCFILIDKQLPVFEELMDKNNVTLFRHPNKIVNLNFSHKDNPRLSLFFAEGKKHA